MALTNKKYERIFSKTGSDADLVSADAFDEMKKSFDENMYLNDVSQLSMLGPVLYQLQQMQDEIDYLRTEISANKDKVIPNVTGTANHAISFGALTTTLVKGKPVYSVVMTVTDSSGAKVVAKTVTLTLT